MAFAPGESVTDLGRRPGDLSGPARLTALLPLRNFHAAYLRQALDSLFSQTDPRWRLRIVTEAPDVPTFRRLLERDLLDPRVALIANEGRKLAGALNTGMRDADTDFVGILLGDDRWALEAVTVLTDYIERFPAADFFHSSRIIVDENDRPVSSVHRSRESFGLEDFLSGSPVKHLLCWRRELALSIGGLDESLNSVGPDDYDFVWSMAERGARFVAIPDALYFYRDHREGFRLTTDLPRSVHIREIRRILRKHGASRRSIRKFVATAKATYLRQCLYRSPLDKWLKQRLGYDPRRGWKQTYR